MRHFASRNPLGRIFVNISALILYDNQTVANIISFICAQQSTATDRYSLSYGPAKLDDAMACFEVETRRAITSSILVR